jgi:REP element-mobilizing transposase RayT
MHQVRHAQPTEHSHRSRRVAHPTALLESCRVPHSSPTLAWVGERFPKPFTSTQVPRDFLHRCLFQRLNFRRALGLKRRQGCGQKHFVTFTCHERKPLLASARAKRCFERALERVRNQYELLVYGYVVMPEHVHLLVSEPERETLGVAIQSLKQGVAPRLVGAADHFFGRNVITISTCSPTTSSRKSYATCIAIR